MAIVAYDPNAALQPFVPEADGLYEGAKIVAYVLIKTGVDVNSLEGSTTDSTSGTTTLNWDTAVTNKDIIEVSPVAGSLAEPSDNTRPGMGYLDTEVTSRSYNVALTHYGVDANLGFYEKLNGSREYGIGLVFEDEKMYVPLDKNLKVIPVGISAAPLADGTLGNSRTWNVKFAWKVKGLPYSLPVPAGRFK